MARYLRQPGPARTPYAVRLAVDERRLLAAAASTRGVNTAEYIRAVSLAAARADVASTNTP